MRVLVVEDSRRLAGIVKRGLLEEGYAVDNAYDGEEAEYMAETTPFDVIVLDIMLPKKDGLAVCRDLRAKNVNTPILMLTAKDSVEDKVDRPRLRRRRLPGQALRLLGAPGPDPGPAPPRGPAQESRSSRSATCPSIPRAGRSGGTATRLELTAKEYAILEYFMRRPNAVVTRTMLGESVWDYEFDGLSNIIDVYVRRIRQKIDRDGQASLIQTVRGAGYRLRVP